MLGVCFIRMSKLEHKNENPIDRICYAFSECVSDAFHNTGHTPNVITTYSAICGIGAIYAVYNGHTAAFVITMVLSFFFDCLDGYMARKYKQTSRFGDLYDHVKDAAVIAGLLFVAMIKFPHHYKHLIAIMVLFKVPLAIHTGCQQKHGGAEGLAKEMEMQDVFMLMCPDKRYITLTRWFGCGTYNFVLIACIVVLMENYKRF